MPYIMVMGSLSAHHLSKDEGATVYGLKKDERTAVVRELNTSLGMTAAVSSDSEKTVRVTQKGLTLVAVNRLHSLLGYDVISHSMAMTNTNRELVSFTMYKKTGTNSHAPSHSSHTSHTSHPASSSPHKPHSHGNVVTL